MQLYRYVRIIDANPMLSNLNTIVQSSSYTPPLFLNNGHLQSIYPTLFRKLSAANYKRQRLETNDGDFLDLDWSLTNPQTRKIAIVSHGLEGHSHRAYMLGMVRTLNLNGWDGLAWNYRGCSGESNRLLRFYHNGSYDDLIRIINCVKQKRQYTEIALIGFSLGGNMTLLYLGKESKSVDPLIKKAITFSVPCHIQSSAEMLSKKTNFIYMKRFLKELHLKIAQKAKLFPNQINTVDYNKIVNFKQFDDRYTAPIHGFASAEDYWQKCSSKPYLGQIRIPTLIVNALNDPFLSPKCFPKSEADKNPNLFLKTPKSGGHCGFIAFNRDNVYWSEQLAAAFLNGGDKSIDQ